MGYVYEALVLGVLEGRHYDKWMKTTSVRAKKPFSKEEIFVDVVRAVCTEIEAKEKLPFYWGYECPRYLGIILASNRHCWDVPNFPQKLSRHCMSPDAMARALKAIPTKSHLKHARKVWRMLREQLQEKANVVIPLRPGLLIVRDYD